MSLTQVLKKHPEIVKLVPSEVKYGLYDVHGLPIDWKKQIVVKSIGKSFEAGIIGTAFDYVARALIVKPLNGQNVVFEESLIAEKGLQILLNRIKRPQYPYLFDDSIGKAVFRDPKKGLVLLNLDEVDPVKRNNYEGCQAVKEMSSDINIYFTEEYKRILEERNLFIQGTGDLEAIICDSILLAELDTLYRTPSADLEIIDRFFKVKLGKTFFSENGTLSDDDILENIKELVAMFENQIKCLNPQRAILNPNFDGYSRRVKADADFIINDILVDIKTKNKLAFELIDYTQVIAYACMGRKLGMDIKKVAIYYARFGIMAILDLDELDKGDFLETFLKAIINRKLN